VLASEALAEEPPELTRPSVPSTCESVPISELVPLPLSVSVELSVEVPVHAELAVVPASLDPHSCPQNLLSCQYRTCPLSAP